MSLLLKSEKAAGTIEPSVLSTLLEELAYKSNAPPDEENVIRDSVGDAYLGGADTVCYHLHNAVYPLISRRAKLLYPISSSQWL